MPEDRLIIVRQAILEDLADRYPHGRRKADLKKSPNCQSCSAEDAEIMAEARFLEAGGFIKDITPGLDPFWKIEYSGLQQIRRLVIPDPTIWGDSAR